jgi:lipoprotein-anchoring transpeptidase ErfK/SrfK
MDKHLLFCTPKKLEWLTVEGTHYYQVITLKLILSSKKFLIFLILVVLNISFASEVYGEEDVYLKINTKKNRLTVILNDVPIYRFRTATGRSNLTPEGEFKIVTKVLNPFYLPKKIAGGAENNPLGTRWMGLNIGNGYKYGIHGTNRPSSIGHSVSSGCIRMRNKDIEFLFRHIPLHTRVVIIAE